MSTLRNAKLRLFDGGAQAFERTFPGLIAAQFGQAAGPLYVCPLCDGAFSREAVLNGLLTAEHVPPQAFGGRVLLLTCQPCNNEAGGAALDAAARMKETIVEALRGRPPADKGLRVRLRYQGHRVNARFLRDGERSVIAVGSNNDPKVLAAFQATATPPAAGTSFALDFVGRFLPRSARISWLRSGFLALFAMCGYRFSCDPALQIVQRPIANPSHRLMNYFTVDVPSPMPIPWMQRRVLEITDPPCVGVQMGRYVVVFPHPGDTSFYDRLETDVRSRPVGHLSPVAIAHHYPFPDEALFGYRDHRHPLTRAAPRRAESHRSAGTPRMRDCDSAVGPGRKGSPAGAPKGAALTARDGRLSLAGARVGQERSSRSSAPRLASGGPSPNTVGHVPKENPYVTLRRVQHGEHRRRAVEPPDVTHADDAAVTRRVGFQAEASANQGRSLDELLMRIRTLVAS